MKENLFQLVRASEKNSRINFLLLVTLTPEKNLGFLRTEVASDNGLCRIFLDLLCRHLHKFQEAGNANPDQLVITAISAAPESAVNSQPSSLAAAS